MNHRSRWLAFGLAAALLLATAGSTGPMAQSTGVTFAEFATMVANLGASTPVSTEDALKLFRRLGFVGQNPNEPMTERQLASVMAAFGFRAVTSNPRGPVDQGLADRALDLLSSSPLSGWASRFESSYGLREVGVCLSEKNYGLCVACCVRQGSPDPACTRFCLGLDPGPSPSNP